jgi:hypothetical protein
MSREPRRRPLMSRFRDFIFGRREVPENADLQNTSASVIRNATTLSLWGATTPEIYEPPKGAEPYDPGKDDDVPWELRG